MGAAPSTPTLADLCTPAHVAASLPNITNVANYRNIVATVVTNRDTISQENFPASSGRNYCNVSFNYDSVGGSQQVGPLLSIDPTARLILR